MDPRLEVREIWKHFGRYHNTIGEGLIYYRFDAVNSHYDRVYDEGNRRYHPGVRVPILWVDQQEATEDYSPEGRRPTQRLRVAVSARSLYEAGLPVTEVHGNRLQDASPSEIWREDSVHDIVYYDGRYWEISAFQIRGRVKGEDVVIGISCIETFPDDDMLFDYKPGSIPLPGPPDLPPPIVNTDFRNVTALPAPWVIPGQNNSAGASYVFDENGIGSPITDTIQSIMYEGLSVTVTHATIATQFYFESQEQMYGGDRLASYITNNTSTTQLGQVQYTTSGPRQFQSTFGYTTVVSYDHTTPPEPHGFFGFMVTRFDLVAGTLTQNTYDIHGVLLDTRDGTFTAGGFTAERLHVQLQSQFIGTNTPTGRLARVEMWSLALDDEQVASLIEWWTVLAPVPPPPPAPGLQTAFVDTDWRGLTTVPAPWVAGGEPGGVIGLDAQGLFNNSPMGEPLPPRPTMPGDGPPPEAGVNPGDSVIDNDGAGDLWIWFAGSWHNYGTPGPWPPAPDVPYVDVSIPGLSKWTKAMTVVMQFHGEQRGADGDYIFLAVNGDMSAGYPTEYVQEDVASYQKTFMSRSHQNGHNVIQDLPTGFLVTRWETNAGVIRQTLYDADGLAVSSGSSTFGPDNGFTVDHVLTRLQNLGTVGVVLPATGRVIHSAVFFSYLATEDVDALVAWWAS